jgi:Fic family protein
VKLPLPAPTISQLYERLRETGEFETAVLRSLNGSVGTTPDGTYRHWDTLRHMTPPDDLTVEEWWLAVKLARRPLLRALPLRDAKGTSFSYCMPDEVLALLHQIDQHAAGEISMPEVVTGDSGAQSHYLVNSLIEEAIRSSQLEGASTTRPVAKELIRSGRPPKDRSERMIVNNFRAMEFIRDEAGETLTPEIVCELQRIVTEGTLENPDAAGRIQTSDDERVVVWDEQDGHVIHSPPPADQLRERLGLMCRFANGEEDGDGFIHPVVRAILLHFWLAYEHPFEDGNGRTARALFYWSLKTQGYWLVEYLSISRIIRQGSSKYIRAFLYTESDENDTTYFIIYHLHIVRRAIEEFRAYLARKMDEVRAIERYIRHSDEFNYRQLALLGNAVRHPTQRYSFASHARSHSVSHQTARNDLIDLEGRELLTRRRSGHKYVFAPVPDLADRLTEERSSV